MLDLEKYFEFHKKKKKKRNEIYADFIPSNVVRHILYKKKKTASDDGAQFHWHYSLVHPDLEW